MYSYLSMPGETNPAIMASGNQLTTIIGRTRSTGDAVEVIGTSRHGQAVLTIIVEQLTAAEHNLLSSEILNPNINTEVLFFWKTRDNPSKINTITINTPNQPVSYTNLGNHKDWTGEISQIGVIISGKISSDSPLVINELVIGSITPSTLYKTVASEWTRFQPWNFASINRILGTISSPTTSFPLWSALWVIFSAVLYGVWAKSTNHLYYYRLTLFVFFIVGWVVTDSLWQVDLLHKSKFIEHQYADKKTTDKTLTNRDQELSIYLDYLKNSILPKNPTRIFIVHELEGSNFYRYRAHFRLLPHNIYSYDYYRGLRYLEDSDWVLMLGKVKELSYDKNRKLLLWGKNKSIQAELKSTSNIGNLYRIVNPTP